MVFMGMSFLIIGLIAAVDFDPVIAQSVPSKPSQ